MKIKKTALFASVLGLCVVAQAGLNEGLIASYTFDGNANDSSGNGHNGSVSGVTLTTDRFGDADSAYDFNGSSSVINCGNLINGSTFTVSAWVNIDSFTSSSYMGPWSQASTTVMDTHSYSLYTATAAGSFGVSMLWADGTAVDDRISYTLPIDEWHMITQTFDGEYLKTYDNGSQINSKYVPGTGIQNGFDFRIGETISFPGSVLATYFDGQIDDVRIYDRALSSTEVSELQAIPEPATFAFLGLFGGGLLAVRRIFSM